LISEIFGTVLGSYTSIARMGKLLIRGMGALLVIAATIAAAYAPIDNPYWLIPASHILHEAVYLIVCGLIVFLFLFGAYFRLSWSRPAFGIALGVGVSACVNLATWAIAANGGLVDQRPLLDFVNMATNHVSVLIWFYYLLAPEKIITKSAVPLPEHNLEVWNRELERLLQQ
jgi:ABC-type transport system involved in cytochrome c biogenesis permease subunit